MPEWLPYLVTAVIGIIIGAAVWIGKIAWPFLHKLSHFVDDVAGEEARPGVPGRPGLMERVGLIEHEVKTNHGTSLKDAVKRIEGVQEIQSTKIKDLHDRYTRPQDRTDQPHPAPPPGGSPI